MTAAIPKSCLQEIQKIQRSFIWGDDDDRRRFHAVNWDVVTRPKYLGGLGIRRLSVMNNACLMKLGWSLRRGDDSLWCAVIRGKYANNDMSLQEASAKPYDSSLWKGIVSLWPSFDRYEYWSIGNGERVQAWSDSWILPGRSIVSLGIVIPEAMHNMCVSHLVDVNGDWNFNILNHWLPDNILMCLYATLPPQQENGADKKVWSGSKTGKFTVSSAYKLLCNFNEDYFDVVWSEIWHLDTPERIRSFVWLTYHDRLLTNFRKSKMLLSEPWCKLCFDEVEVSTHVLRVCSMAKAIWCVFVHPEKRSVFFGADLKD